MKQIPKYEYFLIQIERHNFYTKDLAQEMSNQLRFMAEQGWQVEGPLQITNKWNSSEIVYSQLVKRFHREYMKQAELEYALMYDEETLKTSPIVVE